MKIPRAKYSLESFLDYIVEHVDEVFEGEHQTKWLKAHLVYTRSKWREIFHSVQLEDYGEIVHIVFPATKENKDQRVEFYAFEWAPGLIMMFTSSTEEDYEKTLRQFIVNNRGITESWITPSVFNDLKNALVSQHEGHIYRFISRRYLHWNTPADIRPEYERRISYSGEDAGETLKEYQKLYGVIPTSLDMRVYNSKMQLHRNGLFVIKRINRKTTGVLREVVDTIVARQARLRDTSEKFNVDTKTVSIGKGQIRIPAITAGKITLPRMRFSEQSVSQMFGKIPDAYELGKSQAETEDEIQSDFSFVDTYISNQEPLVFSATVVDELKGTIFGISGSDTEVALVPKHRTTFESFINFYNFMTEYFDENAQLTTFSEKLIA